MFKKIIIKILIGLILIILLIFIALAGYKLIFSQKKITSFEVNTSNFNKHVLIASQGSKFKNQLVKNLIDELKKKDVYIKVTDVSLLKNINPSDWKFIIVINAIESSKMEENVNQFIKKNNPGNNIIFVNTSGSGNFKESNYDIDAISTASRVKDVDNIKNLILEKIIF